MQSASSLSKSAAGIICGNFDPKSREISYQIVSPIVEAAFKDADFAMSFLSARNVKYLMKDSGHLKPYPKLLQKKFVESRIFLQNNAQSIFFLGDNIKNLDKEAEWL